ncbi:hypothetical protein ppKF707_5196 [Metapseudomonas furukawaii]|jgi:hypothetical protein|uniref:Uncharacterized protein n=1 Tax=Metapseudomonas furukawaii TaxID=1149133 RepID=A0AAD1C4Z4_METFU|nr:hypothetical protein ppKF707_5196 [Pseudomonas furukawaii]BAU77132.1 hypothetical protein KF707C_54440 [Pseudomonas furukawaii]
MHMMNGSIGATRISTQAVARTPSTAQLHGNWLVEKQLIEQLCWVN